MYVVCKCACSFSLKHNYKHKWMCKWMSTDIGVDVQMCECMNMNNMSVNDKNEWILQVEQTTTKKKKGLRIV